MKGDKLFQVLKFLEEGITTLTDLTLAIILSGYGASAKKIDKNFFRLQQERVSAIQKKREFAKEKKKLYDLLYKLKKDGILTTDSQLNNKIKLSPQGVKKFLLLKQQRELSAKKYKKEPTEKKIIVIFDIPEARKNQRIWLRAVLKNLGFKMIQKSVWWGNFLIPQELISDLGRLKLLDYIEFYEAVKLGSLSLSKQE